MQELWLIGGIITLATLLTGVAHLVLRRRGESISGIGLAIVAALCGASALLIILFRVRG
ncbi:hypothetical protein [Stenotrophomonas sp. SY1]|jgi:hypothetical protein|uniref:hypothetical protein n=1 Tax=Stenotrophomonas sp. SY1 TaxID=477235 RepID=UPI001E5191A5|nr:hypothetical protein [Stenotrophomonas sp. SY1]MCD9088679.1 hypothetical protein [Stenotrophomonas sp. SY1]